MTRLSTRWLLAGLFVLVGAASAGAQEEESDGGEPDGYRELVASAVDEHSAGRYAEARALFRRAHELSPNARTLRGIGMASFEMREYAAAVQALEQSLEESRRALTEEQRDHARDLVERAGAFVGRYEVRVDPRDAVVRVDAGPPLRGTDGAILLDIGEHVLTATCEGCPEQERRVRVVGGERETLSFVLLSGEELEVDPGGEAGGPATALLVTAGVATAATVGAGVWWIGRGRELDQCRVMRDLCLNESDLERQRRAAVGVTAALGVAAISLGVAGLAARPGEGDEVGYACAPGIGGASCVVRF